ncbi:MAG: TonB-dependent receptor [Deferribacterales bacterium]
MRVLLALMIVFTFSVSVHAENIMQDTIYLDSVTVTDTGFTEEQLKSSGYRVDESKRSNNIADFLEDDPEISLKRKTVIGDSGDVLTIRGQSGQRIMMNLDGRSMNSTGTNGGNYIDFSTIPLDNIERIEVIKGGSSAEYGNNALGGVINAYTYKPSSKPSINLYGTLGKWDWDDGFSNIRGSYLQKFGAIGFSLSGSYQEADEYLWNNDYRSTHFAPKLYIDTPGGGELVLGYDYTRTYRGLIITNRASNDPDDPGYDQKINEDAPLSLGEVFSGGAGGRAMSVIGEGAHSNKIKHMYNAAYTHNIGDNAFVEFSAFMNKEDREDKNYADSTFGGVQEGDLVLDRTVEVDRSYGFKAKSEINLEKHHIILGAEQKNMKAGAIDVDYVASGPWQGGISSSDSDPEIENIGVFLSDTWAINNKLSIDAGLRYDDYEAGQDKTINGVPGRKTYEEDSLTPKLGATYAFTDRDKLGVYVYQSYRTPTIPEMNHYGDALSIAALEDESLKAEKANAIDMAYKHTFADRSGYVKLSAFYYDIKDYLLMGTNPDTNMGRITYNIDNAVFKGVSTAVSYNVSPKVTVNAGAAYQKTKKKGDPVTESYVGYTSDEVDYVPDVKANAGVVWRISDKLTLDTELSYVGERKYFYYGKSRDLDPYVLADASISWEVLKNTTVEFYLDNIFDKEYEEQYGYPSLGINGGVSVKWKL